MQPLVSKPAASFRKLAALLACLAASTSWAYTVPGTANPNLAGRDAGYTCCSGDTVPAHAPLQVTGVSFAAGDLMQFTVSGLTSNDPGAPAGNNPDGAAGLSMTNYGDGISAPSGVRLNALVGVFLGSTSPTGGSTPGVLDFSAGLNFGSLAPGIGQIFFIGDGLTSDSNAGGAAGARQNFVVPGGATRLFLGTTDGFGWFNNSGSFDVTVGVQGPNGPTPVSAPATLGLSLLALGLMALGRKARA